MRSLAWWPSGAHGTNWIALGIAGLLALSVGLVWILSHRPKASAENTTATKPEDIGMISADRFEAHEDGTVYLDGVLIGTGNVAIGPNAIRPPTKKQ